MTEARAPARCWISVVAMAIWPFFLASFGCNVCAIDNPSTNFNGMQAVYGLRERPGLNIEIRESNLDSQFQLDEGWGPVLLPGLLYHLKNPYHVLEYLAPRAQYLLPSTRIARRTMKGLPIQDEPLAYLLDDGESWAIRRISGYFPRPASFVTLSQRQG